MLSRLSTKETFSFRRRNNSNVIRDELIQDLATDIKMRNALHRADMKQADLTVIVEVIRNICCMAVVPKYYYYRKYNLLEVAKINASAPQKEPVQPLTTTLGDEPNVTGESKANTQSSDTNETTTDIQPDKSVDSNLEDVPTSNPPAAASVH